MIQWRQLTYIDLCLSFGNRVAAQCAQSIMWAIVWLFHTHINPEPGRRNSGYTCCCPTHCACDDISYCGYIDDLLSMAPMELADHQYNAFLDLCHKLGLKFSQSESHLSPPATTCVALGLLYDLENNTVSLPPRQTCFNVGHAGTVDLHYVCN